MARVDRVLAIDIGATSIKVGEFEYPKEGVSLIGFTQREYEEELTESSRSVVVAGLLRQMLVENNFTSRRCMLSISGQAAFTRFVKLPPVSEEESRVRQIVEFEARQNVPFPMEEVIWDYQLIANPEAEEMDVMFVVIKNEIVEQMTGAVQAVGLEPIRVDVAPAACYNAARANHVGDQDCAMVLNIGGRSTNLLFADRNRFFARTIPIAGHSITQQIAKEFGIGFAEAEELKRRHGFVALGGAYAEPESEVAAAVSKIIRNVMARLHGEINRSISVYRAHQKGNRPSALFLTGGSSTMTYTDHFFAEKLRMEVHYLNPFQVVNLGPDINRQRLQEVAHMFSEVIGLGLRYHMPCPIEVSLIPETIRRQQALKKKKPYVFAALACMILILLIALLANKQRAVLYQGVHEKTDKNIVKLDTLDKKIREARSEVDSVQAQYAEVEAKLGERMIWPRLYNELFRLRPEGLWLVSVKPIIGEIKSVRAASGTTTTQGTGMGMGNSGGGDGAMEMGMGAEGGAEGGMGMGMGDGGMGMGMGGGGGGDSGGEAMVTGIELYGHSVVMEARGAIGRGRGNADDGDGDDDDGKADEQDEDGPRDPLQGNDDDDDDDDEAKKKPVEPKATPELTYVARLQASELFDEDDNFTGIVIYQPPNVVQNLSTFSLQVKLVEPLAFYKAK
ncbi:MAG: type IV pilus assembly protein PilM [Lentisphaerae bacterium]|nr:type IV pilus assembly protein PilM [Lentisphaerota bacterium]